MEPLVNREHRGKWIQTDPKQGWFTILCLDSLARTVLHKGLTAE